MRNLELSLLKFDGIAMHAIQQTLPAYIFLQGGQLKSSPENVVKKNILLLFKLPVMLQKMLAHLKVAQKM